MKDRKCPAYTDEQVAKMRSAFDASIARGDFKPPYCLQSFADIDVEISRTKNAVGCTLPISELVRAALAQAIRERTANRVEFDGLSRDNRGKQVVDFLLDGVPFRVTNWRRDYQTGKYY